MKKLIVYSFVLVLSGVVFNSCKKDKGDPPVLPPAQSMFIDFSNFDSGTKSGVSISLPKGVDNSSYEFARGVAVIWNSIIYGTLAVPIRAFEIAGNYQPSYVSDKTWQWSYSSTVLSVTYKARLTGQIMTNDVQWKMYITREGSGGFSEFLWFEGTSKLDGTGGQWKLNAGPQSQVAALQIDWTKTGDSVGTIKFTYVKSGDSFSGSYIEYGLTSGTLNAYYKIHYYNNSYQLFYDLDVEWSTTQNNGRVKCSGFFGDSEWYCWDGNYVNVTCP